MKRKNNWHFWEGLARLILRNRIALILMLIGITTFWVSQWQYMRFTFTEANLLPDNHPQNIRYNDFLSLFGEEGSVLVIAVQDSTFFTTEKLTVWKELGETLSAFNEIDYVLSIDQIKELVKNKQKKKFTLEPALSEIPQGNKAIERFKQKLFLELPFYENLLFNQSTETIRMAIYMKQK
ncbi:MAG: RND family transporter, partial [Flavobacteriaceae bacterium]